MKSPLDKKLFLKREDLKQIVSRYGAGFATDRIMVDGKKVGRMYREEPSFAEDSGWKFLADGETQEYGDDPEHWAIHDINTIANYDSDIIPFLTSAVGSTFERELDNSKFVKVENT